MMGEVGAAPPTTSRPAAALSFIRFSRSSFCTCTRVHHTFITRRQLVRLTNQVLS